MTEKRQKKSHMMIVIMTINVLWTMIINVLETEIINDLVISKNQKIVIETILRIVLTGIDQGIVDQEKDQETEGTQENEVKGITEIEGIQVIGIIIDQKVEIETVHMIGIEVDIDLIAERIGIETGTGLTVETEMIDIDQEIDIDQKVGTGMVQETEIVRDRNDGRKKRIEIKTKTLLN